MSCKRGYVLGTRLQNLHHMFVGGRYMVWGKKDDVRYATCS
jgi:hypothetical protein